MIISASRRTDIPAFYSDWFMRRIQAGFCTVPNPFNARQISELSLRPEDVDAIVFWTRNAQPIMPSLPVLDALGHRYLFLYTVLDYPRWLESHTPSIEPAIHTFRALADQVGAARVIWRYDPLVFTPSLSFDYHRKKFELIAQALSGYTTRVIISIVDDYAKTKRRLSKLADEPCLSKEEVRQQHGFAALMRHMVSVASEHSMEIQSCAETLDLHAYGISPGKCIDDDLLNELFDLQLAAKKDPSQRSTCLCTVSRDIGMYNTCLYGCQYCYATSKFQTARDKYLQHDPESSSLYESIRQPVAE